MVQEIMRAKPAPILWQVLEELDYWGPIPDDIRPILPLLPSLVRPDLQPRYP